MRVCELPEDAVVSMSDAMETSCWVLLDVAVEVDIVDSELG